MRKLYNNMWSNYSSFDKCLLCLFIICLCTVVFFLINNPLLWFDESGQFWMALGLNHYSEPMSQPLGLLSALEQNRWQNLDPGGYTALLHFWVKISGYHLWVRSISLLFYLVFLVYIYKIILHYSKKVNLALLGLFVFLVFPHPWLMTEVRPYSMEMCGVAIACYYIFKNRNQLCSYHKLLRLCLILCFFCTSRYEYLIFAFAVSLRVTYLIVTMDKESFKRKCQYMLVYGLPLFFTVCSIIIGETLYQYRAASGYVNNLYNERSLLYGPIAILFYLQIGLCLWRKLNSKEISELSIMCVTYVSLLFVISLAGKYPWDCQRCICMSVLLTLASFMDVCTLCNAKKSNRFALLGLFGCFGFGYILMQDFYEKERRIRFNYLNEFVEIRNTHTVDIDKIFIGQAVAPDIKYLYEYGAWKDFKEVDGYPEKFHFFSLNGKGNDTNFEYFYTRWKLPVDGYHRYNDFLNLYEKD